MNRDLKIWSVILGLLVMGIGITSVTHSFTGSGYRTVKAADEGAKTEGTAFSAAPSQEDSQILGLCAPSQEEALAESEQDCRARLAEYPDRLEELDAQIGRMRAVETDNTVQSVKSAVRTEQEIWERELDVVYSLLSELLDDEEKEKLRAGQQQWIKERDRKARQALGTGNGASMDSVEYSASIAGSTRDRVYELVGQYQD